MGYPPVGLWDCGWHNTRNRVTQHCKESQRDEQKKYKQEQDPGENLTSITINSDICNKVPMEHCVDEPQEMTMMEVEAPVDSPRPDSITRGLAIRGSSSKMVSIIPRNIGFSEERTKTRG